MLINQRDRKLYISHHHLQGAPTSYSRESRKIVWSPFCLGLSRPFPPPYHSADCPKLLFLISPGTAQCLPSLYPYATYEGLYIRTVAFPCKWQGVCAHFVNSSANQDSTLTEVRVQLFPLPLVTGLQAYRFGNRVWTPQGHLHIFAISTDVFPVVEETVLFVLLYHPGPPKWQICFHCCCD